MQPEQPNEQPQSPQVQPSTPHQPLSSAEFASLYATPAPTATAPAKNPNALLTHIIPVTLVIIAIIATLIVGVFAAMNYSSDKFGFSFAITPAVGSTVSQESAQKMVYKALENHMNTPYIRQTITQTVSENETESARLTVTASSNFSDPKTPLTSLEYKMSTPESTEPLLSGRQILLDDTVYAMAPQGADTLGAPYDKGWYKLKQDAAPLTKLIYDPFGTSESVNQPFGEILVGQFTKEDRKALMTYIKEKEVYYVVAPSVELLDGDKMLRVTLSGDIQKTVALNKSAAERLGTTTDFDASAYTSQKAINLEIWISYKSKRIKKVVTTQARDGREDAVTIEIMHLGGDPNIEVPKDAKSA